jgi:transcriptional regulator with XRE-family HTH domain
MSATASPRAAGFAPHLREWRQRRRLSQLELSMASGVSQRHLSFLESGRSQPSRGMVLQLGAALDVPLREQNAWLTAAGFAPAFASRLLSDPAMGHVMAAVEMMLRNHEPYPAAALDRAWNIRLANRAFGHVAGLLGDEMWTSIGGSERNLLRLFFHPAGLRPFVRNWDAVAPALWQRARREAEAAGADDLRAVMAEVALDLDDWSSGPQTIPLVPVIPLEIEAGGVSLSVFTVISTFGTPHDITTDEMRIESLFPADAATDRLFRELADNS